MTSRVVYTALFGETEALLEQPVSASSSLRFLCFTDNTALTSNTWEIVQVAPLFVADPRRSQRDIKIRGHQLLGEYDQWLYIDNTVRLKVQPEEILDQWLVDADWAALNHDAHEDMWREFEANREMSKDTASRIDEQLNDYSIHYKDVLDQRPVWNGMFARVNNEATRAFAALWYDHVLRYSGRDQLSFLVALSERPLRLRRVEGRVRNSPWHDWPHRVGETARSKSTRHARTSGLKPIAEELEHTRAALAITEAERDELAEKLRAEQGRRLFGLIGLWRALSELRRKRRRETRRAKKRR